MNLLIVHVSIAVKSGMADAFIEATLENARNSRKESGVVRFDMLRSQEDQNRFLLVEIYRDVNAAAAHKETDHYKAWRDAVADMMAEPRSSVKFTNLDPAGDGWRYP
jgi:quinol monooxygenase YgiN